MTGRRLALAFAIGEGEEPAEHHERPLGEDEIFELMKETFDAREVEDDVVGMDMNKLMKQAQQMQEQMQKAQEEAASIVVEGSAGGMVTVKATAAGEVIEVKIAEGRDRPRRPRDARGPRARRGEQRAARGRGRDAAEDGPADGRIGPRPLTPRVSLTACSRRRSTISSRS